jgi:hypothetical protein
MYCVNLLDIRTPVFPARQFADLKPTQHAAAFCTLARMFRCETRTADSVRSAQSVQLIASAASCKTAQNRKEGEHHETHRQSQILLV